MKTKTESIMKEMESELLMTLDDHDEKMHTLTTQVKWTIHALAKILGATINYSFKLFLFFSIVVTLFMGAEGLDTIRTSTSEDIINVILQTYSVATILSIVFISLQGYNGHFGLESVRQAKINAINTRVRETRKIVEVVEEVLHRHGHIKSEGSQ
ncbi:hypothetical protein A1QO_04295 [Vibrio genomosp. F10 str. ZF-129]|uniref:Uncharacterized protein n=1 Tax=Vibrio genomosp. F10 str. ZF-129 TaxID=1187848 RepID=A0A1E5BIV9_9VIBR|nr:hypothetical protein [Vibrio genomosp. F10]OEE37333.1 hypothetical protein A1QO_04295 [Vibrio genomosp. F10 str. ZF-129]